MFDVIIVGKNRNSFIKIKDNSLVGFCVQGDNIGRLTEEDVKILNSFRLSEDNTKLDNEDGYEVFLDNKTLLKHYFKDGKEDIMKFCAVNGTSPILMKNVSSKEEETKEEKKAFKFEITNKKIIIALEVINILIVGTALTISIKSNDELTISNYETVDLSSFSEEELYNITYEQVCKYIDESSKLPDKYKEIFKDEDLLNDVIPYFQNNSAGKIAHYKFYDMQIIKKDKLPKNVSVNAVGWYNLQYPNVINILDCDYNNTVGSYDTICHEYIHLLQSLEVSTKYNYIAEASAEIMSDEYYNCPMSSYIREVRNVKLLIETVGPQAIMNLNFAGDDTELVETINSNLPKDKADRLLDLLSKDQEEYKDISDDIHHEIEMLIIDLYQNIYGTDIFQNKYIRGMYANELRDRYYFNSVAISKMNPYLDTKIISNKSESDNIDFIDAFVFEKQLNYKEWLVYKNDEKLSGNIHAYVISGGLLGDESVLYNEKNYTFEEAIKKGVLHVMFRDVVIENDASLSNKWSTYMGMNFGFRIEKYLSVNGVYMSLSEEGSKAYVKNCVSEVEMELPNIYECFPDDANAMTY